MATVHKCDVCKKPISGAPLVVSRSFSDRFEFCNKCAAPILKALKKYKLAP
ncbi:hypothetical protein HY418_03730 [Candidatus Kaiserbacteria bacterium]|nr:hypothetical protein [Candidatus Kaiserbacteria bacterium]